MAGYGARGGAFHPSSPQPKRGREGAAQGAPQRARREPTAVGDLIAGVVAQAGLRKQGRLEQLQPVWEEAVGRQQASRTRLVGLRGGLLTVEVASAGLAQELGVYHKQALVARLRDRSGLPIRDLRCKVGGPWPSPNRPR